MKLASRANVVSSFTIVKGAMIDETHAVFATWDFARTKRANRAVELPTTPHRSRKISSVRIAMPDQMCQSV